MSHRPQQPAALYSIQLLRGVAALFVVLFHARGSLNGYNSIGDTLFINGYIGVDIFFIISGFIFQYVTRPTTAPRNFMLRRIIRILPLYLVAVVVLYIAQGNYTLRSFASAVLRTTIFIPNANENPPFFGYAFLGAGWTLVYEMAFYSLFALALAWSRRFYSALVCVAIIALVTLPQLAMTGAISLHPSRVPLMPHAYLGVVTNPMMLEFTFGVGLAYAYQRGMLNAALKPWVGLVFYAAAAALFLLPPFSGHGPFNFGIAAFLVVSGSLCLENTIRRFAPNLALAVGTGSYSLYLFHQPAFALVKPLTESLPGWAEFSIFVGSALLLATIAYRLFERPIVSLGQSLLHNKAVRSKLALGSQ